MPTIIRLHNEVWIRALQSAHSYECSGGRIWVYLHGLPEDEGRMAGWKTSVPMHEITRSHDPEE